MTGILLATAILFVSFGLPARGLCQNNEPSKEDIPFFSARATRIYLLNGRLKTAASPDGKKNVRDGTLVAAEIMHHSNCDSFGTFKAYVVDLSERRVVKQYGQLAVKRRFASDLEEELLQADDGCIRNPRSCRVNSNHPI